MKFGSVCSGIEAASVAWHPLGWQAAWLAEIEPFPSAVLAHHYPEVPNLGDMTTLPERIASGEVEAPDVFCGGTPCQAFSVAGLRNSLADARGNLSLVFCEIANAIDSARSVRGLDPAIVFWENVPGVLSTHDNAFGCFLGGLAGEDGALQPPGGKWAYAGLVSGPTRTVAWRTLDAQYFGVAQRRRRVFVVASARTDINPAAILFEFEGVRRDTAPSREAGEAVAPCVTAGAGNGGAAHGARSGSAKDNLIVPVGGRPVVDQPYTVANCLTQRMHKGINSTLDEGQTPVLAIRSDVTPKWQEDVAFPANLSGTQCARSEDLSPALCAKNPTAVTYPIDTMNMTPGHSSGGLGFGQAHDPSFALTKGHSHAVVAYASAVCPTLRAGGNSTGGDRPPGTDVDTADSNIVVAAFKGGQGSGAGSIGYSEYVAPTLSSADSGSNRTPTLLTAMQVRRLTPVECERLQGFPDGYTAIPWRNKPAEDCPDGPRYKALGNSWAVPVVRWIGERISLACTHNL